MYSAQIDVWRLPTVFFFSCSSVPVDDKELFHLRVFKYIVMQIVISSHDSIAEKSFGRMEQYDFGKTRCVTSSIV